MKYFVLILSNLIIISYLYSQNVKFTATSKKVVATGEQFQLTYKINAKGTGLKIPSLDNFEILSGPNTSQSSSFQFINGQMSQSVEFTYTYYLRATKEGTFTIKPAEISVDNKIYASNSLTIEVVKGSATTHSTTANKNNNIPDNVTTQPQDISGEDLFVRINVNKTEVFLGEPVFTVIQIYTRLSLAGFGDMKFPSFAGFYSEDIEAPSQVSLYNENLNGVIYDVGVMKKVLLFPQRTGEITIEPFELECIVRQQVKTRPRSIFDSFFGSYQNIQKQVKSPAIKIKVKPLPENKPAGFTGAVGNFSLNSDINKTEAKTNDAITLKIKISGTGNLKLIDVPKVDFPPDFEVYDPKINNNITTGANGSSGNKTIEYLLIPRHAGKFRIAPVVFSYFDISSKQYKTLSSPEYNLNITKGEGDESTTIVSSMTKEDIKYIGSDIRFIKTEAMMLHKKGETYLGSWKFYAIYLGSLFLFFIILFLRREQVKRNANVALVKNRRANKISRKRLKSAFDYMKTGNNEKFYDELLKALWGYLSDKLNIPVSDLSKETVLSALEKHNIDKEISEQLTLTINVCEMARFAPITEASQRDIVFKDAGDIIRKMEQKLK